MKTKTILALAVFAIASASMAKGVHCTVKDSKDKPVVDQSMGFAVDLNRTSMSLGTVEGFGIMVNANVGKGENDITILANITEFSNNQETGEKTVRTSVSSGINYLKTTLRTKVVGSEGESKMTLECEGM